MFSHLRVMTTTGKVVRSLNPGSGYEIAMPDWSPDGRRLAFIEWPNFVDGSATVSDAEIWVTTRSGSWRRLTWNKIVDSNPVWSPDGSKIAFLRGRSPGTALLWYPEKRSVAEIYMMNADGTGLTRLTHNQVGEGSPAWQTVASS
jgi:Tol biopolymer transport system component